MCKLLDDLHVSSAHGDVLFCSLVRRREDPRRTDLLHCDSHVSGTRQYNVDPHKKTRRPSSLLPLSPYDENKTKIDNGQDAASTASASAIRPTCTCLSLPHLICMLERGQGPQDVQARGHWGGYHGMRGHTMVRKHSLLFAAVLMLRRAAGAYNLPRLSRLSTRSAKSKATRRAWRLLVPTTELSRSC